jgi:IS5 family transposase
MGTKQIGLGDYEQSMAQKHTRRERFLAEMEAVVPWKELIDRVEPHYPKTSSLGGRPPYPLETMLRIHLILLSRIHPMIFPESFELWRWLLADFQP